MTIKEKLRAKIKEKYYIELYNQIDESQNLATSRKRVAFAVSQIRNSMRDNSLLLQHNIEYGFFRNLIGGCILADFFSSIIGIYAYHFNDRYLIYLALLLCNPS